LTEHFNTYPNLMAEPPFVSIFSKRSVILIC